MSHHKELESIILELKATGACNRTVKRLEAVAERLKPSTIEQAAHLEDCACSLRILNEATRKQAHIFPENELETEAAKFIAEQMSECENTDEVTNPHILRAIDSEMGLGEG